MPTDIPQRPASTPVLNGVQSAVAANLANVALFLLMRWLGPMPDEIADSVNFLVTVGVASVVGFVTGWVGSHLRTRQWLEQGTVSGVRKVLALPAALALAAPLLVACASYDQYGLRASAATYGGDLPVVTSGECEALARAAEQAVEGPDRASYLTGRAQALKGMSTVFLRHAVQCDRALELQAAGQNTSRVRAAFRRSWRALGEIVQ